MSLSPETVREINGRLRRLELVQKLAVESHKYRVNRGLMFEPGSGLGREEIFSTLQAQIDMLFSAFAPTQEGANAEPSVLDYDEATPLNIGLTKLSMQPQEGTDYLVTLSLPSDMTLTQYLDQCKEQYYKARGHKAPTSVKVQDCRDSSERMAGLFDQWLIFAYTLGQLNPQAVAYMRDTVAGLKEVMDDTVDELTKRA